VVLTFDDGPEPGQTELILETLKRYDIPAVFFLVGHKAQEHPELVDRIRASGKHVIGNHSWDHPNFHAIEANAQALEVERTRDTLPSAPGPKFFRYPFGNSTCETNALVRSLGYGIIGWHIDSCDWAFDHAGVVDAKEAMICGVLPQHRQDYVNHVVSAVRAHHGGIVLMHEIHPNTISQLEKTILAIRSEGYVFTALDDPGFLSSIR
jgi:peptidoglycan/xylan/chitin deacetylase (PgdA/CDA1 family)